MRGIHLLTGVVGTLMAASAAMGQEATPAPAEPSVEAYLCSLAGKCGADASAEAVPVRDAPTTRGFSLARPQQQTAPANEERAGFSLSRPAPETKGFSLTKPAQRRVATPAPQTRGFSLTKPNITQPATTTARPRPSGVRRAPVAAAAAAAPAPLAGAMMPRRADLMVSFELNSDRLTPAGEARAKIFADAIQRPELMDRRFLIAGHTDSVGGRASNLELSRKRAQAVAEYLKGAGVPANRLEVKGMGYQAPLPGRKMTDPQNRRVEAELIS